MQPDVTTLTSTEKLALVEKKLQDLKTFQDDLVVLITDVKSLLQDPAVQMRDEILRAIQNVRAETPDVDRKPAKRAYRKRRQARHWSDADKEKIIAEAAKAKATWGGVARVLEKYGVSTAHLTQWKSQLAVKKKAAAH